MHYQNVPSERPLPQQPGSHVQPPIQTSSQPLPVNKRFRSTAGLTVSGVLMTIAGGLAVFMFGALEIFGYALSIPSPNVLDTALMVVFTACLVGSAVLLGFGIRNLSLSSRIKAFRRAFANAEVLTIDALAAQLHVTPRKALAQTRQMMKRGCIPQGHMDDQQDILMVTDAAYRQHNHMLQMHKQALENQRALEQARAAQEAERLAREKELAGRLTPSQHEFILQVRDYLTQLRALDVRIDDSEVSSHIVAMEDVLRRILQRAENEPSVIAGLGTLTSYYLPTIVNLLNAYDEIENESVQGHTISASRKDIESTLDVTRSAFEKLLDSTYQDLSLDVSADISVLHAMLAREGLTESPFDMKS